MAPSDKREPRKARSDGARSTQRSGDATRQRLIRVAERLFARHGIDAVSLNEIVHVAKVNSAAIHYHFRNREGLIEAIIRHRQPVWSVLGRGMINELEGRTDVTARDVVSAMVLPVRALKQYPWGDDYVSFLSDLADHRKYFAILYRVDDHYAESLVTQLARVTPQLPGDLRLVRYGYLREFIYHTLAATDRRVALWLDSIGQSPRAWTDDDFIDLLTGALMAPVTSNG